MTDLVDFIVIGGGVAGSATAANLTEHGSVLLLEMEDQPGYHSSGRSAAIFALSYGNDSIRALTKASHDFFRTPHGAFWPTDLLTPRQVLITATHHQRDALAFTLARMASTEIVEPKTVAQALALCPVLRPEALAGAALIRTTSDIDVHQLQHGWLRMLRAGGGQVMTGAKVTALDHIGGRWTVVTRQGEFHASTIVNAAGAWAGKIGAMAGALDIGLKPLRRTVCVLDAPDGSNSDRWPMLLDVEEQFYLKPEAGTLLLSPADENLSGPCDAQADELDIAIAIDRIEHATTLQFRRVAHSWAGLRSFVADRSPVIGRDPVAPAFVWYAALGGYGIQTAPALGRLAAAAAAGLEAPADIVNHGVNLAAIAPERLAALTNAAS